MWERIKGLRIKAECITCDDGEVIINDDGYLECQSCLRTWEIDDMTLN